MKMNDFGGSVETTTPSPAIPIKPVVMCTVPVDLIKAIAHIGVDFGYGKYELEQKFIDDARNIYTKLKFTT